MKHIILKKMLLVIFFTSSILYCQNAFVDGIQETKEVEWKENKIIFCGLEFKIELTGACDAKYTATEMWFGEFMETSYIVETKWNWADIASIEIDHTKNTLRFNSKRPMPSIKKDIPTKQIVHDADNVVLNIYFNNKETCKNAANWVLEQIKICGGDAILIN